ncbi:type I restriction endonuclease subunit R [Leptospira johnsonii]|uniref:Type I restriction enzyme endonuclease subunit n=1 Tax=Leptospira johnsonii TaxID=1917820 RepID=A0A2P2D1H5_9LEPT|nr:HsdR family type I site-specific deoxyribonuclease [Leptospira johnsonii]GBF38480.1 type I site-specific deoxyribonuclease, HsdR family [Leptospira johnsonii]
MDKIGQSEKTTQDRIVRLFQEELGYSFLGNWKSRSNSNVESTLLTDYLKRCKIPDTQIDRTLDILKRTATNYEKTLYEKNKEFYSLLRYGVPVKEEVGENTLTIPVIDWENPTRNDFAIAEEVTVYGRAEKRPDLVLYVNGIALAVIELKSSTHSIGEGIRQSILNQRPEFIQDFFSTVQFIFAGNDTEGLRYGTIETKEKYFLKWKEDVEDVSRLQIDKYFLKLCNKQRLLEITHNFTLFDGGTKKLPRPHQYFAIKAAQKFVERKEGGIIWHTQGSGKSILMVFLAKWILENNPNARVAIITDREELDKQIKKVFEQAGEKIYRTSSGQDLLKQLGQPRPRLLCSLIHKFGRRDVDDFNAFLNEIKNSSVVPQGELFVFVDEAHRTQSGKLQLLMKAILKTAVFIGFTGTPLLKKDKKTTLEVFGRYIHTYKFNEAVEDEVVLDLMYEARDIDQRLSSPEKVDTWFQAKTKGLNNYQKHELKKKWGTMQKVLSSKSRMEKIVQDIIFDFSTKPILSSEYGNAILVAGSIYEACKYYELFQNTELKNKSAIITSYNPSTGDIRTEDTGENTETEKEFIYKTYKNLLGIKSTESYEDDAKQSFIEAPVKMKLLIVVDKLLTGFDAPSCSYIYLDKSMQDHGLFQAICRVNRLDGEEKQFGYIIDYKDLFKKVENAVAVYTSEMDLTNATREDSEIILKDRLKTAKDKLENALEEIEILCESVEHPKSLLHYIQYFCGNPEVPEELRDTEFRRASLYKLTANLVRSFSNICNELEEANFTSTEIERIHERVEFYRDLRETIRRASNEIIDLKSYEADMHFLIDHYIQADESRKISRFDDMALLDIIEKLGIAKAIEALPQAIQVDHEASAETIENNIRQKIIQNHLSDPAFYSEMSELLFSLIQRRKFEALNYETYLQSIAAIAMRVSKGQNDDLPKSLKSKGLRALYNNLGKNEELAQKIHSAILTEKPDGWKGNELKERVLKHALYKALDKNAEEVERIFKILVEQPEYE